MKQDFFHKRSRATLTQEQTTQLEEFERLFLQPVGFGFKLSDAWKVYRDWRRDSGASQLTDVKVEQLAKFFDAKYKSNDPERVSEVQYRSGELKGHALA